jgi:uncharacterized membrane protein YeaQ/YmgE (transglycosylase-associated protein family)
MEIILMVTLGALAGLLASMIMGSPTGLMTDIILGIIGAFIGGFIMNLFGASGVTGFNLYSLVVSIIGAAILIALARMFTRRTVI